jgi:hypothetical protein
MYFQASFSFGGYSKWSTVLVFSSFCVSSKFYISVVFSSFVVAARVIFFSVLYFYGCTKCYIVALESVILSPCSFLSVVAASVILS